MASTGGHTLTQYVNTRMDELTRPSCCCLLSAGLERYYQLTMTLEALAGHDTSELHAVIKETRESIEKLKAAHDKAVERFKEQGVLFTVVPTVEKEEEHSHGGFELRETGLADI